MSDIMVPSIEELQKLQQQMSQRALEKSEVPVAAVGEPPKEEKILTKLLQSAKSASKNVQSEVDRIVGLPVEEDLSAETVRVISEHYCPAGTWKLWPSQCKAILQYHKYQGVFIPLKVGGGKTLVICLIASDAYSDPELHRERIIIHCPANLVKQLKNTELPKYRRHISINVPFTFLSDFKAAERLTVARSGRTGVFVVPYSLLQSSTGAELMDALRPDLIICDEVHKVASVKMTGRTRRFKAAVERYQPDLVGLSGTISKKKAIEYHFIVTHALKERSFLPKPFTQAEAWSRMIDADADSFYDATGNQGGGPIQPLIEWAEQHTGERLPLNIIGFRTAYRTRMETCPGVVASNEDDLGVAITIRNRITPDHVNERTKGWSELQGHIDRVVDDWKTPDGDEIDYGIHLWKWRYELEGFGFYNSLYWPPVSLIMKRRDIDEASAKKMLDESQGVHNLSQIYLRTLRPWLQAYARKGMDTTMLVGNEMLRNGDKEVTSELYEAWDNWRTAKEACGVLLKRESKVIRVCSFRVDEVLRWATEHHAHPETKGEGAVIWYKHQGVGLWIYEVLKDAGLPVIHCPAGDKYNQMFEDPANRPFFAVTSIEAHNGGHNAQHWGFQYFAQFPREAHYAEQGMGRSHRNEQKRDEVVITTNISSMFDQVLFSAVLNDAAYAHQTTPNPQKLMYADYETMPKLLPYAVLKEWGADPRKLNQQIREKLEETFISEPQPEE